MGEAPALKKALSQRQLTMIAIGGVIGASADRFEFRAASDSRAGAPSNEALMRAVSSRSRPIATTGDSRPAPRRRRVGRVRAGARRRG